jgi:hypothetical protein
MQKILPSWPNELSPTAEGAQYCLKVLFGNCRNVASDVVSEFFQSHFLQKDRAPSKPELPLSYTVAVLTLIVFLRADVFETLFAWACHLLVYVLGEYHPITLLPAQLISCLAFCLVAIRLFSAYCWPSCSVLSGCPVNWHQHFCDIFQRAHYLKFIRRCLTAYGRHAVTSLQDWDTHSPATNPMIQTACNRRRPELHSRLKKKVLQFLPYGRSIGSWMSYTQDVFLVHVTRYRI